MRRCSLLTGRQCTRLQCVLFFCFAWISLYHEAIFKMGSPLYFSLNSAFYWICLKGLWVSSVGRRGFLKVMSFSIPSALLNKTVTVERRWKESYLRINGDMIKWMRGKNENIILEVECNSLSPHIPQFPLLFQ